MMVSVANDRTTVPSPASSLVSIAAPFSLTFTALAGLSAGKVDDSNPYSLSAIVAI